MAPTNVITLVCAGGSALSKERRASKALPMGVHGRHDLWTVFRCSGFEREAGGMELPTGSAMNRVGPSNIGFASRAGAERTAYRRHQRARGRRCGN